MRWRIIRTLIHKEALRHLSNRGGIALALLLMVMALLMQAYSSSGAVQAGAGFIRGVQKCYIDYWDESDPLVAYLMAHVPASMERQFEFRDMAKEYGGKGQVLITYPVGTAAIQI